MLIFIVHAESGNIGGELTFIQYVERSLLIHDVSQLLGLFVSDGVQTMIMITCWSLVHLVRNGKIGLLEEGLGGLL